MLARVKSGSVSFASARKRESSLAPRFFLFPPKPLRWVSAGWGAEFLANAAKRGLNAPRTGTHSQTLFAGQRGGKKSLTRGAAVRAEERLRQGYLCFSRDSVTGERETSV